MEDKGDEEVADGQHIRSSNAYVSPPESTDERSNGMCVYLYLLV